VRFVATVFLWLVTTVALAVAVPTAWAQKNVVDENGYSALATSAAKDPPLQKAMADELGTQLKKLVAGTGYDVSTDLLQGAAGSYTASAAFPGQFAQANRIVHRWLFTDSVQQTDESGRWQIDLSPMLSDASLRQTLEQFGIEAPSKLEVPLTENVSDSVRPGQLRQLSTWGPWVSVGATILTGVLFVGLNLMGSSVWASQRFDPAQPGAVPVEVTSMQFAWYFRYPGPDGKYGATSVKLMDPSAGGEAAVGLDTSDPAAKDDVVAGTMFLPVNREVDLSLRSVDVIHSFFVPSLRFKQDAVPGLNIHMHFTPNQIGDYEIVCAELCGLGHYKMHGMVKVVSQEDFDKWLAAREAEKQ